MCNFCNYVVLLRDERQPALMASSQIQSSAYCPTQRSYTMTLTNTAYQTSSGGAGYQSLYSQERRDLDSLDVRKETFIFYPPSSIPTADMAAAGFHYTGEGHAIKCFWCKLTVTRLNDGANPLAVHRSRAPNCPFVRQSVSQGAALTSVAKTEPGRSEDTLDGLGLESDSDSSLPSDVEADGDALKGDLVERADATKLQDAIAAKPPRPTAPISESFYL